jgi:hypothetical protein
MRQFVLKCWRGSSLSLLKHQYRTISNGDDGLRTICRILKVDDASELYEYGAFNPLPAAPTSTSASSTLTRKLVIPSSARGEEMGPPQIYFHEAL